MLIVVGHARDVVGCHLGVANAHGNKPVGPNAAPRLRTILGSAGSLPVPSEAFGDWLEAEAGVERVCLVSVLA